MYPSTRLARPSRRLHVLPIRMSKRSLIGVVAPPHLVLTKDNFSRNKTFSVRFPIRAATKGFLDSQA